MKNKFWYSTPSALSLEDWEEWRQEIEKNYPFQYWIRDTLPHWYRVHIAMPLRDLYWFIYRLIKPCHQDIRKVIPRQWADIASLIVDVNFAMLTSFKKEVDESFVDWNASPEHRKFMNWVNSSVHWIKVGRPACEAQRDALYPPHPLPDIMKGKSYDELYGELNKMEMLINETDSAILKQMIDYREYFWT